MVTTSWAWRHWSINLRERERERERERLSNHHYMCSLQLLLTLSLSLSFLFLSILFPPSFPSLPLFLFLPLLYLWEHWELCLLNIFHSKWSAGRPINWLMKPINSIKRMRITAVTIIYMSCTWPYMVMEWLVCIEVRSECQYLLTIYGKMTIYGKWMSYRYEKNEKMPLPCLAPPP